VLLQTLDCRAVHCSSTASLQHVASVNVTSAVLLLLSCCPKPQHGCSLFQGLSVVRHAAAVLPLVVLLVRL
jgi:hypothetical protein